MACCGQKRALQKLERSRSLEDGNQPDHWNISPQEKKGFQFRYTGTTALRLEGAVTALKYTFRYPGDILGIDVRDVPAMMAEPQLDRVNPKWT